MNHIIWAQVILDILIFCIIITYFVNLSKYEGAEYNKQQNR